MATIPQWSTGSPGDQAGMTAYDGLHFYWCFRNYDGINIIWNRFSGKNDLPANPTSLPTWVSVTANKLETGNYQLQWSTQNTITLRRNGIVIQSSGIQVVAPGSTVYTFIAQGPFQTDTKTVGPLPWFDPVAYKKTLEEQAAQAKQSAEDAAKFRSGWVKGKDGRWEQARK